jgi:hypothetical protein
VDSGPALKEAKASLAGGFFATAGTEEPELGSGFYSAPVPIGSYSRRCSRRNARHLAPGKYVPASRSTSVRFGGNLIQPADDRSWPICAG